MNPLRSLFRPGEQLGAIHKIRYEGFWNHLAVLIAPYKKWAAGLVALQIGTGLLDCIGLGVLLPLLHVLSGGTDSSGMLPVPATAVLKLLESMALSSKVYFLSAFLVAIFLFKNLLNYFSSYAGSWFSLRISGDLRRKLLGIYLHIPYSFFLHHKQGRLIHDITNEPERASAALDIFVNWSSQFFNAAALYALMFIISWKATLMVTLFGIAIALFVQTLRLKMIVYGAEAQLAGQDMAGLLAETVAGIQQVKIFSAEQRIKLMFLEVLERVTCSTLKALRSQTMLQPAVEFIAIASFGFTLAALVTLYPDHFSQMIPTFAVFVVILLRLMPLMVNLSRQRLRLYVHIPTLKFISLVLGFKMEEDKAPISDSRLEAAIRKGIAVNRLSFMYPLKNDPKAAAPVYEFWANQTESIVDAVRKNVLENISLRFDWGTTSAIVGHSGSGKSTLVSLLVKLFDPTEGEILVGDIPLSKLNAREWRQQIGFVTQDTFVFHGTIRDNLLFSNPEATEEELKKAAQTGGLEEVIKSLPLGWNTVVGDRGLMLSGGQRQRLAIARAILRDPKILILDEATSSLDYQTERVVKEALAKISAGRIVIVITHRLSTLENTNRIYLIDQGRLVEQGSHEELLAKRGAYYKFCLAGTEAETVSQSSVTSQ